MVLKPRGEVMSMKGLGRHLVMELWGCQHLDEPQRVEEALRALVDACNVTLLDLRVHPFRPHGVTGFALLAESHIAIHTWPEFGYAALDIFTCGDGDLEGALPVVYRHFAPERTQLLEISRGVMVE